MGSMITFTQGKEYGCVGINFFDSRLPGQRFFMWLFESVGAKGVGYPWQQIQPTWHFPSGHEATYKVQCLGVPKTHPLEIETILQAFDDFIDVKVNMRNLGDTMLKDVWGDVCLQFRFAPEFMDEEGERCLLLIKGKFQPANETRRTLDPEAWSPIVQAYRVEGKEADYPKGIVPGLAKWSVSEDKVSAGLIAMERKDRNFTVGLTWEEVLAVAHNPGSSHKCIHSDPGFGNIPPIGLSQRRGRIYLLAGNSNQLLRRYKAYIKMWKKEG